MSQEEEVKVYRSYHAKWGILFTGINKTCFFPKFLRTSQLLHLKNQQSLLFKFFRISIEGSI